MTRPREPDAPRRRASDLSRLGVVATALFLVLVFGAVLVAGRQATAGPGGLVMVTGDGTTSGGDDAARRTFFEGLGWTVTAIDDDAGGAAFASAAAANDVMYVSDTAAIGVGTTVRDLDIGIVIEDVSNWEQVMYGTSDSVGSVSRTEINVADTTLYPTSAFSVGTLTTVTSSRAHSLWRSDVVALPAGAQELAHLVGDPNDEFLIAFEAGSAMYAANTAVDRRVLGAWANIEVAAWTADMATLVERSLDWVAGNVVVVNSTGDSSDATPGDDVCDTGGTIGADPECTLRAAIQEANASSVVGRIEFSIPAALVGGAHLIAPGSFLPDITQPTEIDATTEPDFAGTPVVVLSGENASFDTGLVLESGADDSEIRGLVIRDWGLDGIEVAPGNTGSTIAGNYIGRLDVTGGDSGSGTNNNNAGIWLRGSATTIGGPTALDRNVLAGNGSYGIVMTGEAVDDVRIENNYIGIVADASGLLGNGTDGIRIEDGADGTQVIDNVIAHPGGDGVEVVSSGTPSTDLVVQGNIFGTDPGQTADWSGRFSSISLEGGVADSLIGGTGAGEGNVIANAGSNTGNQNSISIQPDAGTGISILGNSMYGSRGIGIDLDFDGVTANDSGDADIGPNDLLNTPVISSATEAGGTVTVTFDLDVPANTDGYRVEFFTNPSGTNVGGNHEAETFTSAVTASPGTGLTHTFAGSAGDVLTATATRIDSGAATGYSSTSEISAAATVVSSAVTVNSTGDSSDSTPGDDVCDTGGTNSEGDPECTLRAAIQEANASTLIDTIVFAMPATEAGHSGGVWTITPGAAYDPIAELTTIDGTSQPGWVSDPIVGIDGVSTTAATGLTLSGTADGSTVRGLRIIDFDVDGVFIASGADSITVSDSWIGSDGTGSSVPGNGDDGIDIRGTNATIDGSVVNNSSDEGIDVRAAGATITGSIIGLESDGSTGSGNADVGIAVFADGATIGGATAAERNIISRNFEGIELNSSNNVVQGNYIGTDITGTANRGNDSDDGVEIQSGTGTRVGGSAAGEANIIAFNQLDGVNITGGTGNSVLGNSIFSNGQRGIDLGPGGVTANDAGDGDSGANDLLNFPVITSTAESGGTVTVDFDLDVPAGDYRIEAFTNPSGVDPSGNGEGEILEAATTVTHTGSGAESFQITYTGAAGDAVTLTATEESAGPVHGSTSEFSAAYVVTGTLDPVVLDGVQTGTASLAGGSSSVTATIAAVDPTRAFLTFTLRGNDSDPNDLAVTGELTDATTVTFERAGTAGAVTIEWSVVDFVSGVSVQRGSTTLAAATTDIPITTVDPSRSFVLMNSRAGGTTFAANDFPRAQLTSPTNLRISIDSTAGNVVKWQVVNYNDATVQRGTTSFGSGDASRTASVSAVDTSKAWLVYSNSTADGTTANIGQKLIRGQVTDATTLTFDRSSTGQTLDVAWELIEFTDTTSVQHASVAFSGTDTIQNVAITAVDPTRSVALGGTTLFGGRSAYTADDNPGVGWFALDLTSSTNLRVQRDAALATADLGWFVVHWPAPTHDISGTVQEDVDGDGDVADDGVGVNGVDVWLFADSDGDGEPSAGDALEEATVSGGGGAFSLSAADGTYWLAVDGRDVSPGAGFNGGSALDDVFAEQTYGPAGAATVDEVTWSFAGSAGPVFGGVSELRSDGFPTLSAAQHVTRVVVAGAAVTGLDHGFSFVPVTNTLDEVRPSGFADTAAWATFDAGANGVGTDPDGYDGAVFDGRYLYFVPWNNGTSAHGEVLRYDTQGAFSAAGSWTAFDPGANGVGTDPDGYRGGAFDGRYVYFAPENNGTAAHGEVLRYDTTGSFSSTGSWATYDPGANGVGTDPDGFVGATFDGRYVYFSPSDNGTAPHGEVLRYDTTGDFSTAGSWTTYDPGANGMGTDPDGYERAVFDGRYLYFLPFDNGTEIHGEILRYDTTGPFSSATSWTTYDPGANGVGTHEDSYVSGTFDGRYVYFAPAWNPTTGVSGEVLRYDTTADFTTAGSWSAYDAGENGVGTDPDGYTGAVFDGRYVYFAPYTNGPAEHGEVLRYDTTADFSTASSWSTFDAGANGVGTDPDGYRQAVFDGRFVYFPPYDNGTAEHGEVLRYDTQRAGQGSLRRFVDNANAISGSQSSNFQIPTTDPGHASGIWTIVPEAVLPTLTDPVQLDAWTQPGWTDDPVVELDGSSASGATAGVVVHTDDSLIRGFMVHSYDDEGIEVAAVSGSADRNAIVGNWVGIDETETMRGNVDHGILVTTGAADNVIGGTGAGEGNVIGGNGSDGIHVRGTGTDNTTIIGNDIGVTPGGAPIANTGDGIEVFDLADGTRIGGIGPGEDNTVAGNGGDGVNVTATSTTGTAVVGNAIHGNTGLGIDLADDGVTLNDGGDGDVGPNDLLNFPVITGSSASTVSFDLDVPAGDYLVEAVRNPSGTDPTGHGEAEVSLGFDQIAHTGSGVESFVGSWTGLTDGGDIALTATECLDPSCTTFGSTSELSQGFDTPELAARVEDSSTRRADAELSGFVADPVVSDGRTGSAVALDGADDRLVASAVNTSTGELSVSAWFDADGFGTDPRLVSRAADATSRIWELWLDDTSATTATVKATIVVSGTPVTLTGPSVGTGAWHHVGLDWDGATASLVVDGVVADTAAAVGSVAVDVDLPVVIGDVADGSRPFDGLIDEVRVADSARTPDGLALEHALADDPAPTLVGAIEARTDVAGNPGWTVSTEAARSGSHGLVAPPDTPDAFITAAAVDAPAVEIDAWWNVSSLAGIELAQGARFGAVPLGAYETALTGAAGWDLGRLDGSTRTQVTPPPAGQSPVASTWERVTLRVDQDGASVVLHDGAQVAPVSGATDLDGSLTRGSVGFRSGALPAGQRWWIDDLRVRRFTTPEPSTSVDDLVDRP